uniref:hypothetical protein n=1 Tax=Stenotrophomonas maltophilia TaxID=40324 RepID=UPI0019535B18
AYDQVEGAVEDILRANGFKVQRARAILRFDCKVWERRDRKFGKVVVDMTKGMAIGRVTRSNEWTGKSRLIIATYP